MNPSLPKIYYAVTYNTAEQLRLVRTCCWLQLATLLSRMIKLIIDGKSLTIYVMRLYVDVSKGMIIV